MKRTLVAAAVAALALATFFWFPGHTWLQQDTQIYVPILEHQRDASVLRNDLIAQHPHDAFTLYDEAAIGLRAATGIGFREALAAQQIVTRALGMWGLVLLAESFGLALWEAFGVAAICSLGVVVAGPTVLTLEYEATPRAFAVPLVMLAIGWASRGRYVAASAAASIAFLYHAPTTLPFWAVFGVVLLWRREWRAFAPIAIAAALLALSAFTQQREPGFYGVLTAAEEKLQRMRASYVWVSMWPVARVAHWLAALAIAAAAFWRAGRRHWILIAMAAIGVLSMPLSWLLLERMRWALVPQAQPMRALLFTALAMQFFAAVAAFRSRQWWEAAAWFFAAYLLTVQPVLTDPWAWRPVAVVAALAVVSAWRRAALPAALAAFVAIPVVGGVVNYPNQHTPELAQVSAWARNSTSKDAVFLFPDARRGGEPGIFRAEALRAVYVDWKGGGQVNYVRGFGENWWFRWNETMVPKFSGAMLAKYNGLGIQYVVVQAKNRLPIPSLYENAAYVVYPAR